MTNAKLFDNTEIGCPRTYIVYIISPRKMEGEVVQMNAEGRMPGLGGWCHAPGMFLNILTHDSSFRTT